MTSYVRRCTDTVIELESIFPNNPRPAQLDAVMREISGKIGVKMNAIKLGGYWVIGTTEPEWSPVVGGHEQPRTRSFERALHLATGRIVVKSGPETR
jgi:hypothetical protein